jgi:hypothetical protein
MERPGNRLGADSSCERGQMVRRGRAPFEPADGGFFVAPRIGQKVDTGFRKTDATT